MTYQQVLENARTCIGPYCKACNDCNGKVCRNTMPGPGAKGEGTGFIRNAEKWREICVNMDTICENSQVDTSFTLFGRTFEIPAFAAPVGAMRLHYGDKYDDLTYNDILVRACANAGILAFTGDGTDPKVVEGAAAALKGNGGCGVPTIKPWDMDTIREKFALVQEAEPFAIAMDIDAAGLPFLQGLTPPAGSKSVSELAEIAQQAGAHAIIVSNHGGRVLDQCAATAEVLPEIAAAVGGKMRIIVDGGIRSGVDIFKALALGADAVVIARPFVTAVFGGGKEGVKVYIEKLAAELKDTMAMCGAFILKEITSEMVRRS